jgi:hypothetical protein
MKAPKQESLVVALTLIGVAFANHKPRTERRFVAERSDLSGTYRIAFCAASCLDTVHADVIGFLVLSPKTLSFAAVPARARRALQKDFTSVARKAHPDACFALVAEHSSQKTMAAARPVGFTNWIASDSSAELTLYRAPDSGYDVYLQRGAGGGEPLRGVGRFWSGNGPTAEVAPDSAVAWRIGSADATRCSAQLAHRTK